MTGLAALFVALFAVGLYAKWPGWWTLLFVMGFCVVLLLIERHNGREADVDQIWWVPSDVLWSGPLRVVLSAVLMLAVFVAAALFVFGGVGLWLLGLVAAIMFVYRLTLGRMWLKQDRAVAAVASVDVGGTRQPR